MNAIAATVLAVFLSLNAFVHFARPAYVRSLVPAWLGHAGIVVPAAGVALLLTGALLLVPAGRTAGGWTAAALIAALAVAHLDALARTVTERPRRAHRVGTAAGKVLLNVGFISWAVTVAVTAP
jgi:uncharacterized membrane protein